MQAQSLLAGQLQLSGNPWNGTTGVSISTFGSIPLVLSTQDAGGQPIRFLVGPNGSERAVEIGSLGSTWLRGPVAMGLHTGTHDGTVLSISSIENNGGVGALIDLRNGSESTGLRIVNVGVTGSNNAAVDLSSAANGIGTGLRIGSTGPTLGTGIDVRGGTGFRYNSLNDGQATAIVVGGSSRPNRGIDVSVSGSENVGIYSRANTLGSGILGESRSSSYTTDIAFTNTGIAGYARSGSNAVSDTIVGVRGGVVREGSGSSGMKSIGVLAVAVQNSSSGRGSAIGLYAESSVNDPIVGTSIGVLAKSQSEGFSIVSQEGNVFLGGREGQIPNGLNQVIGSSNTQSLTYAHALTMSGELRLTGIKETGDVGNGPLVVDPEDAAIVTLEAVGQDPVIAGIAASHPGRVVTIVAIETPFSLQPEHPAAQPHERILTTGNADIVIGEHGSITLWYNEGEHRWRVLSYVP